LVRHEDTFSNERLETNETDYKTLIESLSPREFDVFLLLAIGLTAHKIAYELCLGYKTVANYGTQIRSKLKVSSAAELAHIAIGLGVMKN
jgi:DNA-binding NarL/FixJ family response regulator